MDKTINITEMLDCLFEPNTEVKIEYKDIFLQLLERYTYTCLGTNGAYNVEYRGFKVKHVAILSDGRKVFRPEIEYNLKNRAKQGKLDYTDFIECNYKFEV